MIYNNNPVWVQLKACVDLLKIDSDALPMLSKEIEIIRDTLSIIWKTYSLSLASNESYLTIDTKNVGYLIMEANGHTINIPSHLISFFPTNSVLVELCEIANEVKRAKESTICISGSSTYFKIFEYMADIDYCEYVSHEDQSVFDGLKEAMGEFLSLAPKMIAYKIKLSDRLNKYEWIRGWNMSSNIMEEILDRKPKDLNIISCDFLSPTSCVGTVEITNRILIIDPSNPDSFAGLQSFPHQEAPLDCDGWVPRTLTSPIMTGLYIKWLINSIEDLCNKKDSYLHKIKAIKRALSLSRIMFYENMTNSILELIDEDIALELAAISVRLELSRWLINNEDKILNNVGHSIQKSVNNRRNINNVNLSPEKLTNDENKELERFSDKSDKILNDLLDFSKQLFSLQ